MVSEEVGHNWFWAMFFLVLQKKNAYKFYSEYKLIYYGIHTITLNIYISIVIFKHIVKVLICKQIFVILWIAETSRI